MRNLVGKFHAICLATLLAWAGQLPAAAAPADPATAFASLPIDKAIRTQAGPGSRAVVMFEDAYCPYCRSLHQSLGQSKDLLVLTFLIDVLNPDSHEKAERIWCAPDPKLALARWFEAREAPPAVRAGCHAPIAALRALARQLHVQATPTILFSDGTLHAGAISVQALERRLGAIARPARTPDSVPAGKEH